MYSKTPVCRTPTILDPRTRIPRMMDGPDYPSLFRGFQYQCAYIFRIPNFSDGTKRRWFSMVATYPTDGRLRLYRKIAYRDSTVHELHDSENPVIPNSDSPGSLTTRPC
jgi:hypothetical protein